MITECSNIYVRSGNQWKPSSGTKIRSGSGWKNFKGIRSGDTWYTPRNAVKNIYQTIIDIKNAGYVPIHFALFDGDTLQAPLSGAEGFASQSGANIYGEGYEGAGRKALSCTGTVIRLADKASQIHTELTFSVQIKQAAANSSYTGFLGGVIFGDGQQGLGYACGWSPKIQGNKPAFQTYTGASAPVYGNSPILPQKWYNIIGRIRITGSTAILEMWLNGQKTETSFTGGTSVKYNNLTSATGNTITLGLTYQTGTNYFSGLLQDFVLWDKALPDGEINKIAAYYNT